ncbi:hypothetical protein HJG60_008386 [Phyllostomus discolor]|uniref:Uncharacterized protein n=1 Tax=Phyllostomus discolor TaxID=89673 RepID=A0A833Z713_9CHIR|nr:hypothetical protein HJG60_008386 [Phyllostomus discolor]
MSGEATDPNDWNFPPRFALTTRIELPPLTLEFPKMVSIRTEREQTCRNVYLPAAASVGHPGRKDSPPPHPQNEDREGAWRCSHTSPGDEAPPARPSRPGLSLPGRPAQPRDPTKALVCRVPSLYGFCNKKC